MTSTVPEEPDAYSGPPPSAPPVAEPPLMHPSDHQWTPGYAPSAYPTAASPRRPNRHAFAIAAVVGAVVWLAAYLLLVQPSVHDGAIVVVESLVVALISAVPVALIAWSSRSRWPVWRYPALMLTSAFVLTLVALVATDQAGTGRTYQRRTSQPPATVGPWTRDDSAAVKVRLQNAIALTQRNLGAGDRADLALYRSGTQNAVLLVITTRPGSRLDDEAARSPSEAVADELAGAGVAEPSMVDPGPLGGALGCGPSEQNKQLYLCVWGELGTMGTITFFDPQLTADVAGETTREFRSQTEHG